jgi:hypothetical protein
LGTFSRLSSRRKSRNEFESAQRQAMPRSLAIPSK